MKKAIKLLTISSVLLALLVVGLGFLQLRSVPAAAESSSPIAETQKEPEHPDAASVVSSFLQAVQQGNLAAASQLTANCTLSSPGESVFSQAARDCFSWTIQGTEEVTVSVTWLNLPELVDAAAEQVPDQLKIIADGASSPNELYDASRNYLLEVKEQAWEAALAAVLADCEPYMHCDLIRVETDHGLVVMNDELYRAITCGDFGADHE